VNILHNVKEKHKVKVPCLFAGDAVLWGFSLTVGRLVATPAWPPTGSSKASMRK